MEKMNVGYDENAFEIEPMDVCVLCDSKGLVVRHDCCCCCDAFDFAKKDNSSCRGTC